MPVLGSLWLLVLLLFVDNATVSAFSTPLLLLNGHHFEPWQVGVFGAASAGAGSTVQLRLFRWVLATDWPWVQRFAPSREAVQKAKEGLVRRRHCHPSTKRWYGRRRRRCSRCGSATSISTGAALLQVPSAP